MKDIILLGIQGAGKGTQAKILRERFADELSYFATGDLFRSLMGSDHAIGNHVRSRLDRGELISDDVTNALFEAYFHTVLHDNQYMLLDGYPRSLSQAHDLLELTGNNARVLLGIHLVLPEQVAVERIQQRGRHDDTERAIRYRIQQYHDKTAPMINYLAEHITMMEINADREIATVAAEIEGLIVDDS